MNQICLSKKRSMSFSNPSVPKQAAELASIALRRRCVQAHWVGVLCFVVIGIIAGGCSAPPPLQEMERIKAIEQTLWESDAGVFSPERFEHFQVELKDLSMTFSREQAKRLPMLRGYEQIRKDIALLSFSGNELLQSVLQSRAAAEKQAFQQIALVEADVERIRRYASKVHLSRSSRKKTVRAELLLAEAQGDLKQGAYATALKGAQSALPLLSPAKKEIAVLINRYRSADNMARWQTWVRETVQWSKVHDAPVIVVRKAEKTLTLYHGKRPPQVYPVSLGFNGFNDKQRAGDGATPEGKYHIVMKKGKGESKFHKALLINYPNRRDRVRLKEVKEPGGLIEIHGGRDAGLEVTRGCVALFNREMDELFDRIAVGTPVTIVGTTAGNLPSDLIL